MKPYYDEGEVEVQDGLMEMDTGAYPTRFGRCDCAIGRAHYR